MGSSIAKAFTKVDRISERPRLTARGSGRFQTIGGGIATLLILLSIAIFLFAKVRDFFQKKVTFFGRDVISRTSLEQFDFRKGRVLPILMANLWKADQPDPSLAALVDEAFYRQIEVFLVASDKKGREQDRYFVYPLLKCRDLSPDDFRRTYGLDQQTALDSETTNQWYYCIDVDTFEKDIAKFRREANIDGSTSITVSRYDLSIYPCDPNTSAICESLDEVNRHLAVQQASFHFQTPPLQ